MPESLRGRSSRREDGAAPLLPSPAKPGSAPSSLESPALRGTEENQPLHFLALTLLDHQKSSFLGCRHLACEPPQGWVIPGCPGGGLDGGVNVAHSHGVGFFRGPLLAPWLLLPGGIFPLLQGGVGSRHTPPTPPIPSGVPQLYSVGMAPSDVTAK